MAKTRRNLPKRGGKFKGQGSYGCGFNPPLKCFEDETRRNNSELSKYFSHYGDALDEMNKSGAISLLDPQRKYFITPTELCPLDRENIRPENQTEKCRGFSLNRETYLLMYEMGGDNLNSIKIPANKVWNFIQSFENLFQGITLLHAGGLVHLDIKPENIVSKLKADGNYLTRFIDFGLSEKISTLDEDSDVLRGHAQFSLTKQYLWYPLDIIFGSYLMKITIKNNYPLYRQYIENVLTKMSMENGIPKSVYLKEDGQPKITHGNVYIHRNKTFYQTTDKFVKSIDIYGLCVSLCQVYSRITGQTLGLNDEIVYFGYPNVEELSNIGLTDPEIEFHRNLSPFSKEFYMIMKQGLYWDGERRMNIGLISEMFTALITKTENPFKDADLVLKSLSNTGRVLPAVNMPNVKNTNQSYTNNNNSSLIPSFKNNLSMNIKSWKTLKQRKQRRRYSSQKVRKNL